MILKFTLKFTLKFREKTTSNLARTEEGTPRVCPPPTGDLKRKLCVSQSFILKSFVAEGGEGEGLSVFLKLPTISVCSPRVLCTGKE